MTRTARFRVALALMIIGTTGRLFAAEPQSYDVHDLLVGVPDFVIDHALQPPSADVLGKRLVDAVRSSLSATVPQSDVAIENGTLHVTADDDGQNAVATLLQNLRHDHATTYTIVSHILRISPKMFAGLDRDLQHRLLAITQPANTPALLSGVDASAMCRGLVLSAPRITVLNNQAAYVAVWTSTPYVADLAKVTGTNGAVGYSPTVATFDAGDTLNVRATSSNNTIAVSLRCDSNTLCGMKTIPKNGGDIQQPDVTHFGWQGIYMIPDERTIAIPCFDATFASKDPSTSDRAFLLIEATATH